MRWKRFLIILLKNNKGNIIGPTTGKGIVLNPCGFYFNICVGIT